MSVERDYIDRICDGMKTGQCLDVSLSVFQKAYPCGWPSIYETHDQAFLSSKIGAMWGCWRLYRNPTRPVVTISRHESGDQAVYVDPDRAHLYRLDPDGHLVLKHGQKEP